MNCGGEFGGNGVKPEPSVPYANPGGSCDIPMNPTMRSACIVLQRIASTTIIAHSVCISKLIMRYESCRLSFRSAGVETLSLSELEDGPFVELLC